MISLAKTLQDFSNSKPNASIAKISAQDDIGTIRNVRSHRELQTSSKAWRGIVGNSNRGRVARIGLDGIESRQGRCKYTRKQRGIYSEIAADKFSRYSRDWDTHFKSTQKVENAVELSTKHLLEEKSAQSKVHTLPLNHPAKGYSKPPPSSQIWTTAPERKLEAGMLPKQTSPNRQQQIGYK